MFKKWILRCSYHSSERLREGITIYYTTHTSCFNDAQFRSRRIMRSFLPPRLTTQARAPAHQTSFSGQIKVHPFFSFLTRGLFGEGPTSLRKLPLIDKPSFLCKWCLKDTTQYFLHLCSSVLWYVCRKSF